MSMKHNELALMAPYVQCTVYGEPGQWAIWIFTSKESASQDLITKRGDIRTWTTADKALDYLQSLGVEEIKMEFYPGLFANKE